MTDAERAAIRQGCGYPSPHPGNEGFSNWRFYQAYGLLEYRLNRLPEPEQVVVRTYLTTLDVLAKAAAEDVPDQPDREKLLQSWRKRLCGFLGVEPGPIIDKEPRT